MYLTKHNCNHNYTSVKQHLIQVLIKVSYHKVLHHLVQGLSNQNISWELIQHFKIEMLVEQIINTFLHHKQIRSPRVLGKKISQKVKEYQDFLVKEILQTNIKKWRILKISQKDHQEDPQYQIGLEIHQHQITQGMDKDEINQKYKE